MSECIFLQSRATLQTRAAPALVKERDGQVKTPEDRNREQDDGADNEMDGEDAIKLYNELVKSPEDPLALQKEIPSLIAARDKAVTAAKRKQLEKETAQKRDQSPRCAGKPARAISEG